MQAAIVEDVAPRVQEPKKPALRRAALVRDPAPTISNDSTRRIVIGSVTNHPEIGVEPSPKVPPAKTSAHRRKARRRGGGLALALTLLIFMGYIVLAALEAMRDLIVRASNVATVARWHLRVHWQRAAADAGWR